MRIFVLNVLLLMLFPLFSYGNTYSIKRYGAKGDGVTDDTPAIQKTIDKCHANGGGQVIFPAGTYLAGTVYLKSNVAIYLSNGAVWKGIPDLTKYPRITPSIPSRMDVKPSDGAPWRAFIYAYNQENIAISGQGTIFPNGAHEVFKQKNDGNDNRPYGLQIVKCRHVTISGVRMVNSAFWMQRYLCCDFLTINGITVFNHCNANNDGLDIDGCHNVVVSDCVIDASDDALCFKSESMRSCRDVVVTNCILSSHASAFKLGTGSCGGFQRFAVSNLLIRPSLSEEMHHPFELWGGIAGIDLGNVDGGITEDILISNVLIDSVQTPIFMRLGKRHDRPWNDAPPAIAGYTRNVNLRHITIRHAGVISSAISGYPGHPIENVRLSDIRLYAKGLGTAADTLLKVDENTEGYPVNKMFNSNLPAYGFYVRHVKNIHFENIEFHLDAADERSAFVFDDVKGLDMRDLEIDQKSSSQPVIRLIDTRHAQIYGDCGKEHLTDFIRAIGDSTHHIFLKDNPFRQVYFAQPPKDFDATAKLSNKSYVHLSWKTPYPNDAGLYRYKLYRDAQLIYEGRAFDYLDTAVLDSQTYNYKLSSVNARDVESKAVKIQLTTLKDTLAPQIEAIELIDNRIILLKANEPLDDELITDVSNYQFEPQAELLKADYLAEAAMIRLTTSGLKRNTAYDLIIGEMADQAVDANVVSDLQLAFIDTPLVLYLPFDRLENSTVEDLSAHKHRGQVAGAMLTEGKFGKALYFNGQDAYVDMGAKPELNLDRKMSVSLWFKLGDARQEVYARMLSKRKVWNSAAGYELECNPARDRLNFSGGSTTPSGQGVVSFKFDTTWHHLVVINDRRQVHLYIDARLIGVDELASSPAANRVPLFIGASPNKSDFFKGTLDEIYIFNRALSQAEIKQLFEGKWK